MGMIVEESESITDSICLYPDQILQAYKIIEPSGFIKVRGVVKSLNPYKNLYVYGELQGHEHSISFRCPIDKAPGAVFDSVIIAGTLLLKPSNMRPGFDVQLQGEVVASWEGFESKKSEFIIPERQKSKLPLIDFLRTFNSDEANFLVVGTKRGMSDYRSSLTVGNELPWHERIINVVDSAKFLSDIQVAIKDTAPKAIVILRGGSDTEFSMQLWNDARVIDYLLKTDAAIYSAIGHSDGYVVLDKFADENFISPTDFGHQLQQSINTILRESELEKKYRKIDQKNDELSSEVEDLHRTLSNKVSSFQEKIEQLNLQSKKAESNLKIEYEEKHQKLISSNQVYKFATIALSVAIVAIIAATLF